MAQPIQEEDVPRFNPSGSVVERRQAAAQHSVSQAATEGTIPEEDAIVIPPEVNETAGFNEFEDVLVDQVDAIDFDEVQLDNTVNGTGSPVVDTRVALMSGALQEVNSNFDMDHEESAFFIKDRIDSGEPILNIVSEITGKYAFDYAEDLLEGSTTEDVGAILPAAQEIMAQAQKPEFLHEQWLALESNVDTLREKDAVVAAYTSQLLQEYVANSGSEYWTDFAGDLAATIGLTPTQSLAFQDITGEFWKGDDLMEDIQEMWRSQTPENQLKMLPALVTEIDKRTGGDKFQTENVIGLITGDRSIALSNAIEMGFLAVDALTGLFFAGKAIKAYKAVGSNKAGQANAAALMDDTGNSAEVLETTREIASIDALPYNFEHASLAQTDGIAASTINTIEEVQARVAKRIQDVTEDGALPDRPLWEATEKSAAETRALSEFDNSAKYAADTATIVSRNETGFTIQYELKSMQGRTFTKDVTYTVDDVERGVAFYGNPVKNSLLSPEVVIEPQLPGTVTAATLAQQTEGRVNRTLTKAMEESRKGLSRKSRDKVNDIIMYGTKNQQEYSIKQLMEVGVNGHFLDEKEVAAYYGARQVLDETHRLQDAALNLEKRVNNEQSILIRTQGKLRPAWGKPTTLPDNVTAVYSGTSRQKQAVDSTVRKQITDGDLVVVKFKEAEVDGEWFEYGLFKPKDVKAIKPTDNILNRSKGYAPLIRKDAFYWVKLIQPITKNGMADKREVAVRYFDNMQDATSWAAEEQRRTGLEHVPHPDRDFTSELLEEHVTQQFGGLYGSPRSSREILSGVEGDPSTYIDAAEAIQRNIRHVSNATSMNALRLDLQARWLKGAKSYLRDPDNFDSEFDFNKISKGGSEHLGAEHFRTYIKDLLRVPTDGEVTYLRSVERVAQSMEGIRKVPLADGVRKGLLNLSQTDPWGVIRAAAFHPLLGWFNPAQFFVQAQSAAVALSLNPEKWPVLFPKYMAVRAALPHRTNEKAVRRIAKTFLQDPDEFAQLVHDFDKTGFWQSLRSNADFDASGMGFGVDKGALGRAADAGLLPYREGELLGRLYSWLWARDDMLIKGDKGLKGGLKRGKKFTMKEIDSISEDATKHMLNLNRSNRAHWQKGAWSIPTQFQQINAKVLENFAPEFLGMGGKKFTGTEKAKVWAGQLALFGAAGVPLGNHIMGGLLSFTEEEGTLNESQLAALTDGAVGLLQETIFGTIIQGSDRLAFAQGMNKAIAMYADGEVPEFDSIFGPFGAIKGRVEDIVGNYWNSYIGPENLELTPQDIALMPFDVLKIVSTFNNLHKSHIMMTQNKVITKNGDTLMYIDGTGDDIWMSLGVSLGLQPKEISNKYTLMKYNKNIKQHKKEALDAARTVHSNWLQKGDYSKEALENLNKSVAFVLSGLTPDQQREVWNQYLNKFKDPASSESKLQMEAAQTLMTQGGFKANAGSVEPALIPEFQIKGEQ